MAKFYKADDDIQEMVEKISSELGLDVLGVDFEALCVERGKEAVSVKRASAVTEYFSKREDLVLVIYNGPMFDLIEEQDKYLWLRMAMDNVSVDTEKDKIIIGAPSFTIPVGFYEKYKDEAIRAALLQHYTLKQIEDKKKAEKEARAAKKKKKDE